MTWPNLMLTMRSRARAASVVAYHRTQRAFADVILAPVVIRIDAEHPGPTTQPAKRCDCPACTRARAAIS